VNNRGTLPRTCDQRRAVEVERTATLWGKAYTITPRLVDHVFGDGRQLVWISPINHRPNYWVVRVDSSWSVDLDDGETVYENIDEILDEIADKFGTIDDDDEEGWFPRVDLGAGVSWGREPWPKTTVLEGYSARVRVGRGRAVAKERRRFMNRRKTRRGYRKIMSSMKIMDTKYRDDSPCDRAAVATDGKNHVVLHWIGKGIERLQEDGDLRSYLGDLEPGIWILDVEVRWVTYDSEIGREHDVQVDYMARTATPEEVELMHSGDEPWDFSLWQEPVPLEEPNLSLTVSTSVNFISQLMAGSEWAKKHGVDEALAALRAAVNRGMADEA
jgi:hypothetical protein